MYQIPIHNTLKYIVIYTLWTKSMKSLTVMITLSGFIMTILIRILRDLLELL